MRGFKYLICPLVVPLFDGIVGGYFKLVNILTREPQRPEKPMVVIIPSYNNARYYKRNLDSVLNQRYHNFRVIYIDDQSPDGTGDLVEAYLKERSASKYSNNFYSQSSNEQESRVQLIKNTQRKGALGNLYDAIHSCNDEEVIVTLDGDDWFAHHDVLARINHEYQEHDAWLTYGNYISFPWARAGICSSIDSEVHIARSYRQVSWVTSHTRTFYAWLFKGIKKEELQENGAFLAVAWDMAFMFPMLEMAGPGHIRFIPEITYIYNVETPLNDYKLRVFEQHRVEQILRTKELYALVRNDNDKD
jgi:glycosyltransferase involved in cell wall biosynthesis